MRSKKLVSVAIVLAMLLSLFSMSVFADGNNVAQIGETEYATLKDAVEAAQDGDTIVLLDDITYGDDHVVAVWEKDFDLDLNGHTFTTNSTVGITSSNNGYKATAICYGDTVDANPHRDISISNGTIRTAYGAGIYADGDVIVTLSGLDVKTNLTGVQTTAEYSSAIRLTTNATVIIEDGSYAGKNAIAVSNSGGNVTVNDGTFVGDIFFSTSGTTANKTITINGGNFTGEFVNADKGILTIYGGTFDHDPTDYVAEGYKAVNNGNGTYTVESRYVAQVGEVKYETLAGAIAAANEIGNVTVTLLKDYDMEANEPGYGWTTSYVAQGETVNRNNMIVISGNDITLDLGGYTLSNLYNNTFKVTGTNITFQNGEMTLGQLYYGEFKNGAITKVYETPTYGSYIVYVEEATNFVVNDLTTFGGINVSSSTATINNLSFSGLMFYAVCSQSGSEVTINNGTYSKAVSGAAKYLFWIESGSVMNITGGNFIKGSANFRTGINPVVSGGTFDFNPSAYVTEDCVVVDNGDGTWTVSSVYAAKIGDVKYATLEDAVEAANAGDTIVLLNDITYDADHSVAVWGKEFNLDLNGHTFTTNSGVGKSLSNMGYTATAICFAVEGEATVSNGTIRTAYGAGVYAAGVTATLSGLDIKSNTVGVQSTSEYSSAVRLTSAATVIIESGSYKGENAIAVSNSGGDVIVNGGDFDGKIFFSKNTNSGVSKSITINGGNFTHVEFVNTNKGTLTIYGGTFDHDPTNFGVADGYEAVNNGDGTYTVGKVEVGEFNETATTEGYDVTYAVTKQVIDENDNNAVINTVTDCKVNVKAVTEDTVYAAETSEFFDNLDMNKVLENVVSYANDAGDTINVEIKVVCADAEVVNETITYEVHPEAIITVNNNAPEAVRISNDALDENAVFTITLPVPEPLAGNDYVKVTHRSTGYADDVQLHAVQGEAGNRYVRFDVTHFSEFELAANNLPLFAGHSISLNGYINLNFYLNLAEEQVTTGEGTVVKFDWDLGSTTYKIKTTDFVSGKGYKATVKVPAAEMTYGITATVYINEILQADQDVYSVRQYANTILSSSPSAELENLVKAMLYYGAKAQLAFGSNLDSLANEGISYAPSATRDELLAGIDAAIAAANNGAHATNMRDFAEGIGADAYYSSSLVYLSGCTLRHYFVFVGGAPNEEDFTGVKSDYYYYVDVTDIAAADLDKLQSFPVGGNTCFYSALDFVKAIIYNYTEGYNYDLAAATYWYNQAANAYFD